MMHKDAVEAIKDGSTQFGHSATTASHAFEQNTSRTGSGFAKSGTSMHDSDGNASDLLAKKRPLPSEFDGIPASKKPKPEPEPKHFADTYPDTRPARPTWDSWADVPHSGHGQPVPELTNRVRNSPANGTYRDRSQEQDRLGEDQDKPVTGQTHESEHVVPFHTASHTMPGAEPGSSKKESRADTEEKKSVEGHGWAYHEMFDAHRAHDGTGTWDLYNGKGVRGTKYPKGADGKRLRGPDGKTIKKPSTPNGNASPAWTSSDTYNRDMYHNLNSDVNGGVDNPSNAIQLNQLGYAHMRTNADDELNFHQNIAAHGTPDQKAELAQSNDSFNHMVDQAHARGEGHMHAEPTPAGDVGVTHTQPLDAIGAAEARASRGIAQAGFWDQKIIDEAMQHYGVGPYAKQDEGGAGNSAEEGG